MFINYYFWISIGLCFLGYFLFRFGQLSLGVKRTEIESSGGLILFVSFPLILFTVGWKALFLEIGVFWIIVTPIVEIVVRRIFNKS